MQTAVLYRFISGSPRPTPEGTFAYHRCNHGKLRLSCKALSLFKTSLGLANRQFHSHFIWEAGPLARVSGAAAHAFFLKKALSFMTSYKPAKLQRQQDTDMPTTADGRAAVHAQSILERGYSIITVPVGLNSRFLAHFTKIQEAGPSTRCARSGWMGARSFRVFASERRLLGIPSERNLFLYSFARVFGFFTAAAAIAQPQTLALRSRGIFILVAALHRQPVDSPGGTRARGQQNRRHDAQRTHRVPFSCFREPARRIRRAGAALQSYAAKRSPGKDPLKRPSLKMKNHLRPVWP
jgi:hypothetical protein